MKGRVSFSMVFRGAGVVDEIASKGVSKREGINEKKGVSKGRQETTNVTGGVAPFTRITLRKGVKILRNNTQKTQERDWEKKNQGGKWGSTPVRTRRGN